MPAVRVDGNDVFAVYNAVKVAREMAVSQCRPFLIEAMTYRSVSHTVDSVDLSYWSVKVARFFFTLLLFLQR